MNTHQFSSVTQSYSTLWDPMNHSMPGLPVHHQLPEFTQTHVHRVSDAIQPSHPLLSPSRRSENIGQESLTGFILLISPQFSSNSNRTSQKNISFMPTSFFFFLITFFQNPFQLGFRFCLSITGIALVQVMMTTILQGPIIIFQFVANQYYQIYLITLPSPRSTPLTFGIPVYYFSSYFTNC